MRIFNADPMVLFSLETGINKLATISYKYSRWLKIHQIRCIWKKKLHHPPQVPQVAVMCQCKMSDDLRSEQSMGIYICSQKRRQAFEYAKCIEEKRQ